MSKPISFRLFGKCLLSAVLMSGLTACKPAVTDMEISTATLRQEESRKSEADLQKELKELNEEYRALKGGYTGPQHAEKAKKADSLKQEKEELESIKADVDAKVARFNSEAKRHRDALAKEKP